MTATSDPAISALGKKAEKFFRTYRIAGLKAVEDAAKAHDDTIEIYATNGAEEVAGSWRCKFGHREARLAIYEFAAMLAVAGLIALALWCIVLVWSHIGFSSIVSGTVATICVALLSLFAAVSSVGLATAFWQLPCKVCLAVSLWTRGWTPVSMEWFEAGSSATWGLGAKYLYVWQKPWHGWGDTGLRVIPYESFKMALDPQKADRMIILSHGNFDDEKRGTEILRLPDVSNGETPQKLVEEIIARAASRSSDVTIVMPKPKEPEPDGDSLVLYPPVRPYPACWRIRRHGTES